MAPERTALERLLGFAAPVATLIALVIAGMEVLEGRWANAANLFLLATISALLVVICAYLVEHVGRGRREEEACGRERAAARVRTALKHVRPIEPSEVREVLRKRGEKAANELDLAENTGILKGPLGHFDVLYHGPALVACERCGFGFVSSAPSTLAGGFSAFDCESAVELRFEVEAATRGCVHWTEYRRAEKLLREVVRNQQR